MGATIRAPIDRIYMELAPAAGLNPWRCVVTCYSATGTRGRREVSRWRRASGGDTRLVKQEPARVL
jgi:hypothetical protein